MAEKTLNSYLRDGLKPYGRTLRVENMVGPGTPDVYLRLSRPTRMSAWVESKALRAFPRRPQTPVRCDHYTAVQRSWHRAWRRQGEAVMVFLRVARTYYLFDADIARQHLGMVPKEVLDAVAMRVWKGRVDWDEWVRLVVQYRWY